MVLKPKIQVRKLFPKVFFNCLITQGVPRLVESIPITMHLQTVIGQMDEVVIAFEGILIGTGAYVALGVHHYLEFGCYNYPYSHVEFSALV